MIHDKMVQIQHKFKELGLTKDEHSAEFEQFIRELVHAEKYINQDLVNKMLLYNSEKKEIKFGAIKDEDKIIACAVIGVVLELDYFDRMYNFPFKDWYCPNYNTVPFDDYIIPMYKNLVYSCIPRLVNFNNELSYYNPVITAHSKGWIVKLNIGRHLCILHVDSLSEEVLHQIQSYIDDVKKTINIYNSWKQEGAEFIRDVQSLLADEDYEVSNHKLELPLSLRMKYKDKRNIRIQVGAYESNGRRFDISQVYLQIDLYKGPDVIARMCKFESYDDSNNTLVDYISAGNSLPDFEEMYQNIKILVDSGFKNVIMYD